MGNRMANRKTRTLFLSLLLMVSASSFGWNDVGHRTIVAIANARLTPEVRAEVTRLLAGMSLAEASVWADNVRRDRPATGPWHYKDTFFRRDGKPVKGKPGEENAVWAIRKFTAILGDKTKSDAERGEALRWVLHFVGDIHQPLHAVSFESDALADGDAGGNRYKILAPTELKDMARPPENLHSLWDLGAGTFRPGTSPDLLAQVISAALPAKKLKGSGDLNPDHWAKESFTAAKDVAYQTPDGAEPSAEYLANSRQTVVRRAALSGYRLAELLNRTLGASR
jgi:S1/P1 Nuclease